MIDRGARSAVFAVAGVFLSVLGARADGLYPAVEVVCAPQINHFSLTTKTFEDADAGGLRLGTEPVFTIRDLVDLNRNPLACKWMTGTFKIRVATYHVPEERGMCGGVEYGNIQIDWDDVPVALIEEDQCGEGGQSVEAQQTNSSLYIKQCAYKEGNGGNDSQYACKAHFFDLIEKKMKT